MPETFCVEGFWGAELRCSRKELFNQVGSSLFKRVKWFFGLAEKPSDPDRLSRIIKLVSFFGSDVKVAEKMSCKKSCYLFSVSQNCSQDKEFSTFTTETLSTFVRPFPH